MEEISTTLRVVVCCHELLIFPRVNSPSNVFPSNPRLGHRQPVHLGHLAVTLQAGRVAPGIRLRQVAFLGSNHNMSQNRAQVFNVSP